MLTGSTPLMTVRWFSPTSARQGGRGFGPFFMLGITLTPIIQYYELVAKIKEEIRTRKSDLLKSPNRPLSDHSLGQAPWRLALHFPFCTQLRKLKLNNGWAGRDIGAVFPALCLQCARD